MQTVMQCNLHFEAALCTVLTGYSTWIALLRLTPILPCALRHGVAWIVQRILHGVGV